MDNPGHISRAGDADVRSALYVAAPLALIGGGLAPHPHRVLLVLRHLGGRRRHLGHERLPY
jgi:hypothetical protein